MRVTCRKVICLNLNVFPGKWFHLKDLACWHLVCARKMGQSMSRNSQTTPSILQVTLVLLAYFWPLGSRCRRSSKKRCCAQGISMLKNMKDIGRLEPENWNIPLAFRSTWPCLRRTCAGRALDSVLMWELVGNLGKLELLVATQVCANAFHTSFVIQQHVVTSLQCSSLAYGLLRASRGHGNWGRTEPSASRRFNEGRRLGWMKFGQDKRPTK